MSLQKFLEVHGLDEGKAEQVSRSLKQTAGATSRTDFEYVSESAIEQLISALKLKKIQARKLRSAWQLGRKDHARPETTSNISNMSTRMFDRTPCVVDAINHAAAFFGKQTVRRPLLAELLRSCVSTQKLVSRLLPYLDEACGPRLYREVEANVHLNGQPIPAIVAIHAVGVLWDMRMIITKETTAHGIFVGSETSENQALVFVVTEPASEKAMAHLRFDGIRDERWAMTDTEAAKFACAPCGLRESLNG